MNAIDQMMQAQGANSSQAIASFFSSQKAGEGEESAFAAVFANLMQNFAADGTKEITSPEAIKALDELSPAEAEFLASLGVQIPAAQEPASFQPGLYTDAAQASGATVNFQKVLPASLINIASADGNASDGTTTIADIAALPESAKAELLQALKGMEQAGKAPALTLSAADGEAHILPVAELEALINGTQAGDAVVDAPVDSAPATAPAAPVAPATPAATAAEVEELVAQMQGPDGAPVDPERIAAFLDDKGIEYPDWLKSALADITPEQADAAKATAAQQSAAATAAAAAASAQAANAQEANTQQKQAEQAQNTPDGYMVAANQPQNANAQQNANGNAQAGKKANTAALADKAPASMNQTADGAQSKGEALTARAIDPVVARSETALPPNVARDPALSLTPERLAGMQPGSAGEMVSAGLAGIRGDGGFMSSMSLLGGHASRGLQGHVAKQLNMSVSRAVKAGEQEFTMRLDPAELGRVQVKLKFMEGGRVHAQVVAERPETLELLQRDARGLERAIQGAGAKAQGATIEFSLDQGGNQESAGKAFAEAVQQEKMRDALAARSAGGHALPFGEDDAGMEDIPLEDILPYVDAETGLDIRV